MLPNDAELTRVVNLCGMQGHDIVVMGGSAGSIDAMRQIVAALPSDLPAAIFVVVHTAAGFDSVLPEMLSKAGPLRATHAIHGEPIALGHIYVAPPDNHILVRQGHLAVQRGPKENGHRPAVDPLFRSASSAYGSRVVGVVVSGYLDCGTGGLLSVKSRGGIAIVQQPQEALSDEMPRSAIDHVAVDYVLPVADIGPLVARLAREPAPRTAPPVPASSVLELEGDELGLRSNIVCPICQGAMTEAQLGNLTSFRCHVGHAFTTAGLLAEQAESLERALWAAMRALEESATITKRMALSNGSMRTRLDEKARTQSQQADVLRQLLLRAQSLTVTDGEDVATANVRAAPPKTSRDPSPKSNGGKKKNGATTTGKTKSRGSRGGAVALNREKDRRAEARSRSPGKASSGRRA
jgi:two-component system chemotaxis response regulator CheB